MQSFSVAKNVEFLLKTVQLHFTQVWYFCIKIKLPIIFLGRKIIIELLITAKHFASTSIVRGCSSNLHFFHQPLKTGVI